MKSIYELIEENLDDNGLLDSSFSLPENKEQDIRFIDGAVDGISLYHMAYAGIKDEELNDLADIIKAASDGNIKKADDILSGFLSVRGMIGIIDDFREYITEHADEFDPVNIFQYAVHLVLESPDKECVKAGLTLLSLFDLPDELQEVVRTIGISDEFTLFSLICMFEWDEPQKEIFSLAKRVHGWGRIHAVEYLSADTDEVKRWLLFHGVENSIMPEYSAYTCYEKAGVADLLRRKSLTQEEVHAILNIIGALLSEGPVEGIAAVKDPGRTLLSVVRHAHSAEPLKIEDYDVIEKILAWTSENPDADNDEIRKTAGKILKSNNWAHAADYMN